MALWPIIFGALVGAVTAAPTSPPFGAPQIQTSSGTSNDLGGGDRYNNVVGGNSTEDFHVEVLQSEFDMNRQPAFIPSAPKKAPVPLPSKVHPKWPAEALKELEPTPWPADRDNPPAVPSSQPPKSSGLQRASAPAAACEWPMFGTAPTPATAPATGTAATAANEAKQATATATTPVGISTTPAATVPVGASTQDWMGSTPGSILPSTVPAGASTSAPAGAPAATDVSNSNASDVAGSGTSEGPIATGAPVATVKPPTVSPRAAVAKSSPMASPMAFQSFPSPKPKTHPSKLTRKASVPEFSPSPSPIPPADDDEPEDHHILGPGVSKATRLYFDMNAPVNESYIGTVNGTFNGSLVAGPKKIFAQFINEQNATVNATKNPLAIDTDESYTEEARRVYAIQPMDPEAPHPPAFEQVFRGEHIPDPDHPETPIIVSRVKTALGLTRGVDSSGILFQPEEMKEHNEWPSDKWVAGIQFEPPADIIERLVAE